jgi:hypothetical protein
VQERGSKGMEEGVRGLKKEREGDILFSQNKIPDSYIFTNVLLRLRTGNDDKTSLNGPTQKNLCICFPVFLAYCCHCAVLH